MEEFKFNTVEEAIAAIKAGNAKKVVSVIKNPANLKMILLKQIGSYLNPFKEL